MEMSQVGTREFVYSVDALPSSSYPFSVTLSLRNSLSFSHSFSRCKNCYEKSMYTLYLYNKSTKPLNVCCMILLVILFLNRLR